MVESGMMKMGSKERKILVRSRYSKAFSVLNERRAKPCKLLDSWEICGDVICKLVCVCTYFGFSLFLSVRLLRLLLVVHQKEKVEKWAMARDCK